MEPTSTCTYTHCTCVYTVVLYELAEVKQLYQAVYFDRDKLKQKLEETQASLAKVCPLLSFLH